MGISQNGISPSHHGFQMVSICLNTNSWSNESNDLDDLGGTPVFRKPPYAFMISYGMTMGP